VGVFDAVRVYSRPFFWWYGLTVRFFYGGSMVVRFCFVCRVPDWRIDEAIFFTRVRTAAATTRSAKATVAPAFQKIGNGPYPVLIGSSHYGPKIGA
jgi:hypothetical protein